jgi:2'-5' RNA ligase
MPGPNPEVLEARAKVSSGSTRSAPTPKTYATAVVLIPPDEVWPSIQDIRRVHDRNFYRWMPHITMLYPFAKRKDFPRVAPELAEAAAQVKPFQIRLARFDHFRQRKYCTIFLSPEPEDLIVRLHSGLVHALPDLDDTARYAGGFHPHLSVGQFQHRQVESEQERLQAGWTPVQFTVSQVSLIYRAPETGDRFVAAKTFPLAG